MAINEWKIHRTALTQSDKKIMICDDDSAFLAELQGELERIFAKLNIKAEIREYNAPSTIDKEYMRSVVMAFLDIDFEDEEQNGLDIARRLREVNRDALLFFVTNYIDYAPEGFEVKAFRYILKRDMTDILERYIMQAMEQLADEREFLQLREDDRSVKVPLKQIRYIEVLDHYVSIHTKKKSYVLATTLSNMENALDSHGFLRVHKSYLVNMAMIRKFRSRECILTDDTVIPVGEKSYAAQKQKYLNWKVMHL